MAKKMTKKELRGPDAFQRVGGEAQSWFQGHQRTATLAVVLMLLAGGGVALAGYVTDRGEEKADQALAVALKPVSQPVGSQPTEPGLSDPESQPFKTQEEKDEAVVKSLTAFRASHSRTKASATAALPLGQAELRLQKYDEAVAAFDDYLKRANAPAQMNVLALEGRGYAFEGKGQLDEALRAFDQLAAQNKTDFLPGMGQFHHARILAEQNKKQEAAVAFRDVKTQFPTSAAAQLATERLTLLASQGVKPPPATSTLVPVPSSALKVLTGKDAG